MQKDDEQAFVAMEKDAEIIEVHPSNVEQHKRLGWRLTPASRVERVERVAVAPPAPVAEDRPKFTPKGKG
jgi:hypothetical protein